MFRARVTLPVQNRRGVEKSSAEAIATSNENLILLKRSANAVSVLFFLFALASLSAVCSAQGPAYTSSAQSVTDETMTPTPGGHDYIHMLGETVSPSNGSVSYKIEYPMPKGRGLNFPFWYGFNSTLFRMMFQSPQNGVTWVPNSLSFSSSIPSVTYQISTVPSSPPFQCGPDPSNTCVTWPCNAATGFTFTGPDGASHNLGMYAVAPQGVPPPQNPPGTYGGYLGGACPTTSSARAIFGGDGEVTGQFINPAGTASSMGNIGSPTIGNFTVTDKNGTTYFFSGNSGDTFGTSVAFLYQIEDRNGNLVTTSGPNYIDTLGRPVLGSQTIGGISYPAPTPPPSAKGSVSVSYNVPNSDTTSPCFLNTGVQIGSVSTTSQAWNAVALPDGTQYTFFFGSYNPYDSSVQNPYGLINEVIYPGGGWVKYYWSINSSNANEMATFPNLGPVIQGITYPCSIGYSTPMLAARYVSYDGKNLAQVQRFTYQTNWSSTSFTGFYSPNGWTSKVTTVQTTDEITGKSKQTIYTYVGGTVPGSPNGFAGDPWGSGVAVEQSVQDYDWGGTAPLKTVTKSWYNIFQMACEFTTVNGLTSGHVYHYMPNSTFAITDYLTDDQEFDYSQVTPSNQSSICNGNSGIRPFRETKTTFTPFTDPIVLKGNEQVGAIFYKPQSVVTLDSGGNKAAETDYAYDQFSLVPANPVQTDSNYSSGAFTVRGNVTTATHQCFVGLTGCTNSIVTGTYDTAGQLVSRTDPCGNANCSPDMTQTNHTVQFSYADNPSPCSGGGNAAGTSDAYLTQIAFPQTGNVSHVYHFCYNYTFGDLTSTIDENNQVTGYQYNDPMDRLTETDFPDGGKTTIAYNGETSINTTQLMQASPLMVKTTTNVMDGMFHTIQTQLTSDPQGTDITDITYDGESHAWRVSNPHRSSNLSTDGMTQTDVDGIGRTISITRQDGSMARTIYGTSCLDSPSTFGVAVVDEAGNVRQSCTNSLGQLLEVDEPNPDKGGGGGVAGTGGVTVNFDSSQVSQSFDPCQQHGQGSCPQTAYNNGTIDLAIGGCSALTGWGPAAPIGPFTVSSVASNLAAAINDSSCPVTATANGGLVDMTANDVGVGTNYSFSVTNSYVTASCGGSSPCFSGPEFYATPTSGALTGGTGGIGSSSLVTLYTYDGLSNLTCVEQHGPAQNQSGCSGPPSGDATSLWRIRRFGYDSLSRLLSAKNPESGTILYTYDANSNLATKIAPSPNQPASTVTVTTTYSYDDLNRITGKSYSDTYTSNPATAPVTYLYDDSYQYCRGYIYTWGGAQKGLGIGRRTSMCDGSGTKNYEYDPMGRLYVENDGVLNPVAPYSANVATVNGVPLISNDTNMRYYLNGDLLEVLYPGGISNYEFYTGEDTAGHVNSAGDVYNHMLEAGTYTPAGQLATGLVGTGPSYNGNKISNTYNNRLQPVLESASTWTGTPILNLTYNFNLGNGTSGTDNGNVIQIINGKDNNRTQNFVYDGLNRIQEAYTSGPNWGEAYHIDPWGNLTNISPVSGKTNSELLNAAPATPQNRLPGYTYDAAGNMIANGLATYVYDAENHLIAAGGMSYIYDGDGNRIEKCTEATDVHGNPLPGVCAANATGTVYWLHPEGGTLAESDLSGNPTAAYGIIRGQIASRVDLPAQTVHYYFHDHLGSTNVITDTLGNVQKESDFYPYGGEIPIFGNDPNRYKFTGKERDAESGLDNFGARYDASSLGRFMTPDWAAKPTTVPYAVFGDPQTLNLYAYVENAPVNKADADGHTDPNQTKCDVTDTSCKKKPRDEEKHEEDEAEAQQDSAQAQQQHTSLTQDTKDLFWGEIDAFAGKTVGPGTRGEKKNAQESSSIDGMLMAGFSGEGAAAGRALELAEAMGKTKDFVTIAVTETKEGVNVVSSSENALRSAVEDALTEGEVAAKGAGHAEVTGVNAARQMGLTPTGVAASRGICPSCAQFLRDVGVAALSALRGMPF